MIKLHNAIYTLLTSNTGLTAIIGTRVYPLVLPQDTPLPAVVIERSSNAVGTKDGVAYYNSVLTLNILAASYTQSIAIAVKIDSILSGYRGTVDGITMVDVQLTDINENYQEEAYFQNLVYTMKNN